VEGKFITTVMRFHPVVKNYGRPHSLIHPIHLTSIHYKNRNYSNSITRNKTNVWLLLLLSS